VTLNVFALLAEPGSPSIPTGSPGVPARDTPGGRRAPPTPHRRRRAATPVGVAPLRLRLAAPGPRPERPHRLRQTAPGGRNPVPTTATPNALGPPGAPTLSADASGPACFALTALARRPEPATPPPRRPKPPSPPRRPRRPRRSSRRRSASPASLDAAEPTGTSSEAPPLSGEATEAAMPPDTRPPGRQSPCPPPAVAMVRVAHRDERARPPRAGRRRRLARLGPAAGSVSPRPAERGNPRRAEAAPGAGGGGRPAPTGEGGGAAAAPGQKPPGRAPRRNGHVCERPRCGPQGTGALGRSGTTPTPAEPAAVATPPRGPDTTPTPTPTPAPARRPRSPKVRPRGTRRRRTGDARGPGDPAVTRRCSSPRRGHGTAAGTAERHRGHRRRQRPGGTRTARWSRCPSSGRPAGPRLRDAGCAT